MSQESVGHGEKRSRKQEQAIAALLECQTVKQAAERAGVGETTRRGWLKLPDFREAYHEARRECVDRAVARLEKGFELAVAVLQKIAGDAAGPTYARVAAAKALMDSSFKAIELYDVGERVRKIEDRLFDRAQRGPIMRARA